ncbi:MAG: O-acetyl-ADP-ribose deacetylase [Marinicellaceae bacterium]
MAIKLIKGDITKLEVDTIVNAANSSLCGGGGVDGAIHRAAGKELLSVCRNLGGCKAGQAKITDGFKLPANYIIHTVGPVWYGGFKNEAELLKSCYVESLKLFKQHRLSSIAFPSISCGSYRFPIENAAKIAIDTIQSYLENEEDSIEILLVNFDEKTHKQYKRVFNKLNSNAE